MFEQEPCDMKFPVPMSADDLYREEVIEARALKPEDKLLEGARLFDRSCVFMTAGIRHQHPQASEAEVNGIIEQRLDLLRRIEEAR